MLRPHWDWSRSPHSADGPTHTTVSFAVGNRPTVQKCHAKYPEDAPSADRAGKQDSPQMGLEAARSSVNRSSRATRAIS